MTPTRPSVSRLPLPWRIGKGAPDRELLFCSGNQALSIGEIQIRVHRASRGTLGRGGAQALIIVQCRLQAGRFAIQLAPLCDKPCGLLNIDGFYDSLLDYLDHSKREGFLRPENRAMLLSDSTPVGLIRQFEQYTAPRVQKWTDS